MFTGPVAMVVPSSAASAVGVAALCVLPAYAWRTARREGLDARSMYWGAVAVLGGALWGGHALPGVLRGDAASLRDWLGLGEGGASSLAALAAAAAAGGAYARARRISLAAYADALVPAALLAYAVARVGCLLNGDDYGARTALPWAVRHPPGTLAWSDHLRRGWISADAPASLPVHPWPLYSAAVALALFALLRPPRGTPGSRVALALVGYGGARFLLEFLRGDEQRVLGPLVVSQLLCVLVVAAGVAVWLATRRAAPAAPAPLGQSMAAA